MWWFLLVCSLVSAQGYLLPGDVRPSHYDLRLLYDLDPASNFSFYGVVDIQLTANKPTSKIVLHAQDFSVVKEHISVGGVRVTQVELNDNLNFLTIFLNEKLQERRNYTLTIPFFGNLKMGLDGVYISSYQNKISKSKEYLITTQFEAISARKGFPCFDEPLYKATFSLTIGHDKAFTAVSNMPLKTSSEKNAVESHWPWQTVQRAFRKNPSVFVFDEFVKSVPMSTYLVAFVVSRFGHVVSPAGLSTTQFRIWSRSDAINQTEYAANIGPRVLDHFEKFFTVPFPLPKQDMIAIPDFSAGAMENWGLITYRETALLYDADQSSFLNKERVAEVVAHELAHQWFGNLVTMKWWSDLWLNEGFATYMASVGVAAVEPTWDAEKGYAIENIMRVLGLDALESSHPVSVPIEDPKRISEIFDEISYSKGAALIRMMTHFLGEEVFRKAIHNYLVKYSYQNAEQDDLWAELTAVSQQHGGIGRNVTVKAVMDTWTTQTGYPLLTVTRDYADKSLTITQKRFLSMGSRAAPSAASWWVPLHVVCEPEAKAPPAGVTWLGHNEGATAPHRYEHGASADEWVLFNYDMIAPYRVNYDARNWQLLSAALTGPRFSAVPVLARVQLLSDAFELAWSDQLDYNTVLHLTSYLRQEREYLPLWTGLRGLGHIENAVKRSPDYGAFQKYVRRLVGEAYTRAGGLAVKKIVNGHDLVSVKMQVMTSSWACRMHVPDCEENAIDLFRSWMASSDPDSRNPIPLDLRRTVYCVAISRGSVREWRFALARMQRTNVAAARDALLSALACTREVWILNQYLEWAVTEGSEVRRQDAGLVLSLIARSSVGYYVARDFIYTRIHDIHNTFKNGQGRRLGNIIKALLDQFTTDKEMDEFKAWYAKNSHYFEDAKLSVEQGLERAANNIAWINRSRRLVVDKLREFAV